MSEYKNNKGSEKKPFKKLVGGSRPSKAASFGKRKRSDDYDNISDENNSTKKSYNKEKYLDNKAKPRRRSSDLVPKIEKSFSNFEKKEKSKSYGEKPGSKDFKSKKPFYKEGENKDSEKPFKKEYTRKKEYGTKKSYSNDSEKKGSERTFKKDSTRKPDFKSKKPFVKDGENKESEKPYKKEFTKKREYSPKKTYSNEGENKGSEKTSKRAYTGKKEFGSIRRIEPKRPRARKTTEGEGFEGVIRLNRYIAASGICSRREADELIELGEVKVNGVVVTEMGTKVNPTDKVEVGGQSISPERKVYVLLNKPKDFVSTVSDPHAERTVLDLVKLDGHERIYPVGRLDKNTTGVMLLTNDGELTKKLTHPSYNKKKVYHVVLDKPATKAQLQQIAEGFLLEDGFINADAINFVKEGDKTEIGIEIHSGRNRIVRRIFEHLGFEVVKLDRVYFAGLTKKNVARGKWRYLSEKEISMLKMGAYE
jgi:23S rRNA pseudouridine2605 synthase